MPYILVRHKVDDFAKWKPKFDEHSGARKAAGSKGGVLFRSADDPNEMVILMEWDDLKKAKEFSRSDELRERLKQDGVLGQPDLYYLEEVDKPVA